MVSQKENLANISELAIRPEDKPNEELIRQVISKVWREINTEGFTKINRPPGKLVRTNYETLYLYLKNGDKKYAVVLGASQVTRERERELWGVDLDIRDDEEQILNSADRVARIFQVRQTEFMQQGQESEVDLWKIKYAAGPEIMVAGHPDMSEEERKSFLLEIQSSGVDSDATKLAFEKAQEKASQPGSETVALFWNRNKPSRLPAPE